MISSDGGPFTFENQELGAIEEIFFTRLPNTDFPGQWLPFCIPCSYILRDPHIARDMFVSVIRSGMSSVIRKRRLEATIISEHWTLHPSGRNTEAQAENMVSARRMYLQFLRIRGKKFISPPPVKKSQELIMLSLQVNPHCSLPPRGIAEACSCPCWRSLFLPS